VTYSIGSTWCEVVRALGDIMKVGREVLRCEVCRYRVDEETDPGAENFVSLLLREAALVFVTSRTAVIVSIITCKWIRNGAAGKDN
jgi:hypothetical protein